MKKTLLFTAVIAAVLTTAISSAAGLWFQSAGYSCSISSYSCCEPTYYEIGDPVSLFNGSDLAGWTDKDGNAPGDGWVVKDGAIFLEKPGAGDLFTVESYSNFILEFEFKMEENTNSGLKYRLWNKDGSVLGCEYQIYNREMNGPDAIHDSSSLYDVFVPNAPEGLLKRDDYNQAKIVVKGRHIEHWLNGVCTVSVLVNSPEWCQHVAASKFSDDCEFGQYRATPFFLQDHTTQVWFRNITVRRLTPIM